MSLPEVDYDKEDLPNAGARLPAGGHRRVPRVADWLLKQVSGRLPHKPGAGGSRSLRISHVGGPEPPWCLWLSGLTTRGRKRAPSPRPSDRAACLTCA
ncbi:hypothetical protein Airi02_040000 [Actinoallomurus iriomotensis]|uniref:Uncharacterized protein n=1 Tax=Actinoallomurus iriomotensis TaxID=478107 RepID=A0A9W6S2J2_9ACTN|nr:hypothetical protein Airi02_040000 [Actinoallomurus iriomotensis]